MFIQPALASTSCAAITGGWTTTTLTRWCVAKRLCGADEAIHMLCPAVRSLLAGPGDASAYCNGQCCTGVCSLDYVNSTYLCCEPLNDPRVAHLHRHAVHLRQHCPTVTAFELGVELHAT